MRAQELAMTNGDGYRVVATRPWVNPLARGAGPNFPARGEGPDTPTRRTLRSESGSFGMCKSDRDREVGARGGAERIRPVEEAGKMLEWDWGSERLAVAESCLPSRVAEGSRLGFGF